MLLTPNIGKHPSKTVSPIAEKPSPMLFELLKKKKKVKKEKEKKEHGFCTVWFYSSLVLGPFFIFLILDISRI